LPLAVLNCDMWHVPIGSCFKTFELNGCFYEKNVQFGFFAYKKRRKGKFFPPMAFLIEILFHIKILPENADKISNLKTVLKKIFL
jgi:hypothetical protein